MSEAVASEEAVLRTIDALFDQLDLIGDAIVLVIRELEDVISADERRALLRRKFDLTEHETRINAEIDAIAASGTTVKIVSEETVAAFQALLKEVDRATRAAMATTAVLSLTATIIEAVQDAM